MVESEEVSLQATEAEARERFCCSKCDREVIPQFCSILTKTTGFKEVLLNSQIAWSPDLQRK